MLIFSNMSHIIHVIFSICCNSYLDTSRHRKYTDVYVVVFNFCGYNTGYLNKCVVIDIQSIVIHSQLSCIDGRHFYQYLFVPKRLNFIKPIF